MRLTTNPCKNTARLALAGVAIAAALAGGAGTAVASAENAAVAGSSIEAPVPVDENLDEILDGEGPATWDDPVADPQADEIDLSAVQAVEDSIAAALDAKSIAYTRETYDGVNYVQLSEETPVEAWDIIQAAYDAAFPEQAADAAELAAAEEQAAADAVVEAAEAAEPIDMSQVQAIEDAIAATFDQMGVSYTREDIDGVSYVWIDDDAPDAVQQVIAEAYTQATISD